MHLVYMHMLCIYEGLDRLWILVSVGVGFVPKDTEEQMCCKIRDCSI